MVCCIFLLSADFFSKSTFFKIVFPDKAKKTSISGHFLEKQIRQSDSFLYPATLKSAGYYVIPSIQKIAFECWTVRQSISASFSLSAGAFLTNFL